MNEEAKKELKRVLKKAETDPLEDHEKDFLRARKVYIKKSQLAYLGKGFFEVSKGEKKQRAKKKLKAVEDKELVADEANRLTHPAEKKEQLPYRELQALAKKKNLKYIGVSRKDLEKLVT